MKRLHALLYMLVATLLFACSIPGLAPAGTIEPFPTSAGATQTAGMPAPAVEATLPVEVAPPPATEARMPFALTSSAFSPGEPIPEKYSCKGEDLSPPLAWGDPPEGTLSFALIMDDPDAPVGSWDHWIVFNLPADARALDEGLAPGDAPATFGGNSWGRSDYGGPCPPSGTHRYFFKLYALDTVLDLGAGAGKSQLQAAMQGHVLAEAELMGTFSR